MSKNEIVRVWTDPAYRNSLSAAERGALPANPAGPTELSEGELAGLSGGGWIFTPLLSCPNTVRTPRTGDCCGTVRITCPVNPAPPILR